MAHLIHITPETRLKAILRNGIAATRYRPDPVAHPEVDRVVWAYPVLPSYTLTHIWARELKRHGVKTVAAVTISLPDEAIVYAHHYNDSPQRLSLAAAVHVFRTEPDPRGFEIMIPRRIEPKEIVRSRVLTKVFGWRQAPHLKGKPPMLCDCPACLPRGEVNAARQRGRLWDRMIAAGREPDSRLYKLRKSGHAGGTKR